MSIKPCILTFLLSATILPAAAQENDTPVKNYRNEFGIDATGFLKQFLNFNDDPFYEYYVPTYYLTYRLHFSGGNIRFGLGGAFTDEDIPAVFPQDSNRYNNHSYSLAARLGWEFTNEISRRWQVFYGLDFRPSFTYYKNDARNWNGGYATGEESKSTTYGVAPLLGFRFRLTERLSLATEASFSVNWQESSLKRYFTPLGSQYPPMPEVVFPKTNRIFSTFAQPLAVMITFDI